MEWEDEALGQDEEYFDGRRMKVSLREIEMVS